MGRGRDPRRDECVAYAAKYGTEAAMEEFKVCRSSVKRWCRLDGVRPMDWGRRRHIGASSTAAKQDRLRIVEGLVLRGWSYHQIARKMSGEWGLTYGTVRSYVGDVYDQLRDDSKYRSEETADAFREEHRRRLSFLYGEALKVNQLRTALRIAISMAQLDGFLTSHQLKVTGTVSHQHSIEDPEHLRQINEILEAEGFVQIAVDAADVIDVTPDDGPTRH